VTRGIDSIPNDVMRASTSAWTSSGFVCGHSHPISVEPGRSAPTSDTSTRPMRTTMSPLAKRSAADVAIAAPASR
jgi:hypothetical protein